MFQLLSKNTVRTLAAICVIHAAGCAYPVGATSEFSQSADWQGVKTVIVETRNGQIETSSGPELASIAFQARKHARGLSHKDALAAADEIEVDVQRDPLHADVLRIIGRFPPVDGGRNRRLDFHLSLPDAVALDLKTSNGEVTATGAANRVSIETSNGRVNVRRIAGDLHAKTSNGAIAIEEVSGSVEADSSCGAIRLRRVKGERIEARTSNGQIVADQVSGHTSLRTSNGSIELTAGALPPQPTIRAVTSNGSVRVEVPRDTAARLRIKTSLGRINCDLNDAVSRDVQTERNSLSATLNDGGGAIDIETSLGSVTFRTSG